jgi:glycosyltransferase involved in cell wall biosynthesis
LNLVVSSEGRTCRCSSPQRPKYKKINYQDLKILHLSSNDNRIRVCMLATAAKLDDVRLFHREGKSLVKAGFDVHVVFCGQFSGVKDGIYFHAVRPARNRLHRILIKPWVVMWKSLKTKASIYHFHNPDLLIVGSIMRWFLSKKVIFDMRESTARQIMGKKYLPKWSRKIISTFYGIVEWICLKGIAVIVANDRGIEEYKNAYLVRNFPEVDANLMASAADMPERLKSPLLIYVGGVWERRGAWVYIELARQLKQRSHKIRMMIIGPPYEKNFGQQLKEKVRELNLEDTVEITGFMNYQKAMELTTHAAIGLCILKPIPNYTFCLAGKIIEYMMCGTPVIASNFEHWRPYVEGERVGRLVNPDDIDEIVNVCEQMLSNSDALAAMGKRGMEAVRSKYNWSIEFKELLRCYNDLLNR